jgi:hypothetical protein
MKTLQLAATMISLASALAAWPGSADAAPGAKWLIGVSTRQPRITEQLMEQIQPGLTEAEVKALIGPPQYTTRLTLSNTVAWDYEYRDFWGYDATFSVIFNSAGLVVGRVTARSGGG